MNICMIQCFKLYDKALLSGCESTCVIMYKVDPFSSWAYSVRPVAGSWILVSSAVLAPGHTKPHSSCWYRLLCTHTHTHPPRPARDSPGPTVNSLLLNRCWCCPCSYECSECLLSGWLAMVICIYMV